MVLWSNPEAVMEALLLMYKLMRGLEVRQLVTGYLTAMVLHRKQQGVVLIKDCLLMHKFMRGHKVCHILLSQVDSFGCGLLDLLSSLLYDESTSPRSSEMVLVYLPTQLTLFVDNDLW
ncbi:PREDICTED: uncharacterized protein LOC101298187 isoform 1 [Fragaria vesca subsp. vesca]|uniref:uncharacterized protein LOC101298187 n=1 Tax=Fragaria vesca subsp. vesca TaxID=101020 RepID=UPI0002C3789A|nr:PREDICTED: uncharacterized protein LOC101298187 [Fragaria vesca subsp. vesca]